MLMAKFSELKVRKERVDQITELLLTLKQQEDQEALGNEAPPTTKPLEEASEGAAESSHATGEGGGTSELVTDQDGLLPPGLEELQMKLR